MRLQDRLGAALDAGGGEKLEGAAAIRLRVPVATAWRAVGGMAGKVTRGWQRRRWRVISFARTFTLWQPDSATLCSVGTSLSDIPEVQSPGHSRTFGRGIHSN
jgi:hypothetical protein